ncbi:MAG: major capsid protein [Ignavibacteriales bacterium]|nr:major capsid protein [Ignavibacteriales bacterium]
MSNTIPTFGYVSLTEAVNSMISVPSFIRSTIFKGREPEYPTTSVLVDIIVGGKKIAPFVKRGNPAKMMSNTGLKSQTIQPPSIRLKKFLTPSDLGLRAAGDSIFVPGSAGKNPVEEARKKKVAIEQKDLKDIIDRTIEFMCMKALTGGYTITQPDLQFSIDMGMPSANKPTLTGTNKWDAPTTCTPLANLRAWRNKAYKASGKVPTIVLYNSTTFELFLKAEEVLKYLDKKNINLGDVKTDQLVLEMGAIKTAELDGMVHYMYDATYTDVDGNEQQFIPDGVVILASTSADNRIHFAAIEEIPLTMAKYFSKDKAEDDPAGLNLIVESDPLPVCHQPDANIYATVA